MGRSVLALIEQPQALIQLPRPLCQRVPVYRLLGLRSVPARAIASWLEVVAQRAKAPYLCHSQIESCASFTFLLAEASALSGLAGSSAGSNVGASGVRLLRLKMKPSTSTTSCAARRQTNICCAKRHQSQVVPTVWTCSLQGLQGLVTDVPFVTFRIISFGACSSSFCTIDTTIFLRS
jgi:hypothetical protein